MNQYDIIWYIYIHVVASVQTSQAIPSSSGQNMQTLTNPDSGHPEDEGNAAWGGDGREGPNDNACWHMLIRLDFWVFPKIGVPQIGWFIIENPIKMDDLGVNPLFSETTFSFHRIYKTTRPSWIWLLLGRLHHRCGMKKTRRCGKFEDFQKEPHP